MPKLVEPIGAVLHSNDGANAADLDVGAPGANINAAAQAGAPGG